ncbi:MAG: DUF4956 domain-containing protein [Chitinophagales bacterium]|nr:MAG: DUF4956 domain-containing protein [Chitinophagales bacterium]
MSISENPLFLLLLRLVIDIAVTFIIVRLIYFPRHKDKDYLFTFFVFNLLVYLVCHFMNSLELSVGFAFGLFALFGILRYRTITIPIKEMTYLFTVIVLAIINALGPSRAVWGEILVANGVIVLLIFILENLWLRTPQGFKVITYEKIELIKPDQRQQLLRDLQERTGLEITEIDIDAINFLNDTAVIKVYYNPTNTGVRRIAES